MQLLINLLRWLVQKFLIKFCIKKIGKKTAVKLLRKFLIDYLKRLPQSRLVNRVLEWLKEAPDEEIGLLLEPERAVWEALERMIQGKTNRLELNENTPHSLLRDNNSGNKDIDWESLLGGDINKIDSLEPYTPPPSTQFNRYGIDQGYGNNGIGHLFRYPI